MTVDTASALAERPYESGTAPEALVEERIAAAALTLLPGGLVVYFGFEAGGFFAGSVATATLVVIQILILRLLFAARPFAGFSRPYAAVVGVFAAYTAWTAASALWSNAPDRALTEFDRALLYLMLLALFGLMPRSSWRMRWMTRGIAGGALVVCAAGLITRVLPQVWPTTPGLADSRLSFPVTYWNALGILASIAVLLLFGIASDRKESRVSRALAAAAVPVVTTTLLFTFSRGGMLALACGLIAFAVVARTGSIITAAVATAPGTAVAVVVAYKAKLLATNDPTTPAAVVQGHHVALVVAVAVLFAGLIRWSLDPFDRWLARRTPRFMTSDGRRWGSAAVALVAVLAVALIAGAPGWISNEYRQFVKSAPVPTAVVSQRLTSASSDGRIQLWAAALKAFSTAPILGTGAGTYQFDFYRYRSNGAQTVVDTHNLYLQTLAELGVVGLVLLAGALATILVLLLRRARGPDRVLYAALLSAALAWALHAAIDWDWQMPVVTAWLFAVAGAALAAESTSASGAWRNVRARVMLGVGLLAIAVVPTLLLLSQIHLQRAADAFTNHNCIAAQSEASSSIAVLGIRPEPYQILAYCDMQQRHAPEAVAEMQLAVRQEPNYWQYRYGVAIADALAGINPRPELRAAMRLDPFDPVFAPLLPVLHTRSRAHWAIAARNAETAIVPSGRLTLR